MWQPQQLEERTHAQNVGTTAAAAVESGALDDETIVDPGTLGESGGGGGGGERTGSILLAHARARQRHQAKPGGGRHATATKSGQPPNGRVRNNRDRVPLSVLVAAEATAAAELTKAEAALGNSVSGLVETTGKLSELRARLDEVLGSGELKAVTALIDEINKDKEVRRSEHLLLVRSTTVSLLLPRN